ncbi:hypothetical protein CA267_012690 [Alteromonas pelagimontana]|uniref:Uncharacterized protein n=1 Tax=Alteromonas pelagimontana TaxID=1858656 RepID=A0A6M4MEZ9_9ALTE|nr:hypothetical protein [Alteromonas pelagimontana]QJR81567.1 hypothetical protein CA267_012690 [Alteromonas pelagimontana]
MQQLSEISPREWIKGALVVVALFLLLQFATSVGQISSALWVNHQTLDEIESRVSLDTAYLDVGNQTLNTFVNESAVHRYIKRINSKLSSLSLPARILSIQDVALADDVPSGFTSKHEIHLTTSEQSIKLVLAVEPWWAGFSLSPVSILGALIIAPLLIRFRLKKKKRLLATAEPELPPVPKLIINLVHKTLGNGVNTKTATMQNKPFCFYVALVQYGIENPTIPLLHNKDAPPELTAIANKIFSRLIELGHTKRKRPDFNANLDKTLSEVRATLDDVFEGYPVEKERYYPPRAQGEGSRSKQHSFALTSLTAEDVEIIGS